MTCKKLNLYDCLENILDKYDKCLDFQYRAVIYIWSSLEVGEKLNFLGYYNFFFERIKRN